MVEVIINALGFLNLAQGLAIWLAGNPYEGHGTR
jgi:hypothetical protein